jgi:hypothetical protein
MAINWLFALRAVPWSDVVQAAPAIVKGARKLFNSVQTSEPPPVGAAEPYSGADSDSVQARLNRLEIALQNVDAEQNSSAELIRSLAEQNARVVEAIEVLRARTRLLLGLNIGLSIVLVAFAIWVVTR